jgi:non-ribosomal peptide synthetase component E (peptide arylation enzyme)
MAGCAPGISPRSTPTATSPWVGRKKELIIRGGMNITPRELEDLIGTFAEVSSAAVVGAPDERLGEVVCACVVLHPGATLDRETVVARLRDARLRDAGVATYKLPQRLELLPELPMTASGKIQKHEILRHLEEPWGERSFYAVDPWGNDLCFCENGTLYT